MTVRFILPFAILFLPGCILLPHTERIVPTVSGTIAREAEPVANANVYLVPALHRSHCAASKYAGVTDRNGHFSIRGDSRFELFALLMGDRIMSWGVCVADSSGMIEAYSEFGFGFPPSSVTLTCDLAKAKNPCVPSA